MPAEDLPILEFPDMSAWERWLEANHESSAGVWLKIARKGSGVSTVTYAEALEEALCCGWIDGQKAPCDQTFWLQRFTPRGPRSKWSKIYREKASKLLAEDRMKTAGLAQVEQAKEDGRWEAAYESQRTATVPEDLRRELEKDPEAKAFFDTLDSANRYAILYRLKDAKKPETRARRLAKYVAMLGAHEKLHP